MAKALLFGNGNKTDDRNRCHYRSESARAYEGANKRTTSLA